MITKTRMTVEAYLALPEEPPYLEYVDGEVIEKAMPDWRHMVLVDEAVFRFHRYRDAAGGFAGPGPRIEFTAGETPRYRLPDYAYWAPEKPFRGPRFMHPPTLAIEVRSPEESLRDQRAKCRFFREYGVDVAWFIDPDRRLVEVFEGARDGEELQPGEVLASPSLPGFRLDPAELWARLGEAQG
jgi:Uma2 family endonuclease